MGIIFVIIPLAISLALGYATLKFPEWFMRSMQRNVIWHLRDDFVDQILQGNINKKSSAAKILLDVFENETHNASKDTLASLWLFSKVYFNSSITVSNRKDFEDSCTELPDSEKELLLKFLKDLLEARMAYLVLGTWYGIGWAVGYTVSGNLKKGKGFWNTIQKSSANSIFEYKSKNSKISKEAAEDFLFYKAMLNN